MEEGTEMLTFEQWSKLCNQLDAKLVELDARCIYRRLQVLGPLYISGFDRRGGVPDIDESKLITDDEYIDLVYLRDRVRDRLNFVRETGKRPPDMDQEE